MFVERERSFKLKFAGSMHTYANRFRNNQYRERLEPMDLFFIFKSVVKTYKSCWDWMPCKEFEIFKTSTSSSHPTRPYCINQKQPKSRNRQTRATSL